jgi:hypothetical protein
MVGAVNPPEVHRGDQLTMTDLRVGESYPVTVESVDADGKATVVRDDNGARYRVGIGFLTVRKD